MRNTNERNVRVGLFGVGLDTYWPQFAGLKERLEGYVQAVADIICSDSPDNSGIWTDAPPSAHTRQADEQPDEQQNAHRAQSRHAGKSAGPAGAVELVNAGLVDNPQKAALTGTMFREQRVDIIFLYISTYALSSTVLPVVREAGAPVIVLNIQPVAAINYTSFNAMNDRGRMTGEWLAHCQACAVPEIANVCNRAGIDYHLLTGYLGDESMEAEIHEWIAAARTAKIMRANRLGLMGHYYGGMLDVYSDLTRQLSAFGGHAEIVEIDELAALCREPGGDDVAGRIAEFRRVFQVAPECGQAELERAARTSLGLDRLVERHELGSLAYFYAGEPGSVHEDIISSVIAGNTLLTARHVPVAGEYEVKNAQAMKIMDSFDAGGSFSEFYAMDFADDVVLLGHDGPAHAAIAEGRVGLVPLPVYHGKPGRGLSIQMTVKNGPVTVLSVVEGAHEMFLLVAEGESVPGPVLHIGNTNSRYRFPIPVKDFINRWAMVGPSHHSAIGIGHIASKIDKFAQLTGISMKQIC
ncbi:MAG: arabinose isomerase [Salinispira sp.]